MVQSGLDQPEHGSTWFVLVQSGSRGALPVSGVPWLAALGSSGAWWLLAGGGGWLVVGGWWLAGGWWLVVGGWRLVIDV